MPNITIPQINRLQDSLLELAKIHDARGQTGQAFIVQAQYQFLEFTKANHKRKGKRA